MHFHQTLKPIVFPSHRLSLLWRDTGLAQSTEGAGRTVEAQTEMKVENIFQRALTA